MTLMILVGLVGFALGTATVLFYAMFAGYL